LIQVSTLSEQVLRYYLSTLVPNTVLNSKQEMQYILSFFSLYYIFTLYLQPHHHAQNRSHHPSRRHNEPQPRGSLFRCHSGRRRICSRRSRRTSHSRYRSGTRCSGRGSHSWRGSTTTARFRRADCECLQLDVRNRSGWAVILIASERESVVSEYSRSGAHGSRIEKNKG
jgi:hypothetical protein